MTVEGVTGIVPVHNGERFLAEALESMFGQSHPLLEVIVVDDGSTDGTADVVGRFGERVRYVFQERRGPVTARNAGIGLARGSLIAFLDADDLWHLEKVARQVARFEDRPELDYCVTAMQNFWMPEVAEEGNRYADQPRGRPMPGYLSQTLMARRQAFDKVGMFDEGLRHRDAADWFVRARAQGAIEEYLADVLTYRRVHRGNRSRHKAERSPEEALGLVLRALRNRDRSREIDQGDSGVESEA